VATSSLLSPTESADPELLTGRPRPGASVIVVAYNAGRDLEPCLSALTRACGPDDEIILVDNASRDGSAEETERAFPGVTVIRSDRNLGFGGGNNLGARLAASRYLAFLNPDTIVEPGWLQALVDALEANPQAGLATSKILLLRDPSHVNTCGNEVHCTGLTVCRGIGLDPHAVADGVEVQAVSGAAFAVRRDLFELLEGFDESFFLYMEDTDLSWRARLAGYRCIYVPTSIVYHDYALRFGPRKTFYQERNRYQMLLKSLRWRSLVVLSPALFLAESLTWGFVLVRERDHWANKLRAYAWVLHHWGEVLSRRKQVQSLRQVRDRDLLLSCTYRLAYEQVGDGLAARLAHLVLDPLFFLSRRLALTAIWW
jgi:GT2 family glycosyltransferase